ncbi:cbb3-type cytochrome c oxidase subunit I [Edaphobacter aggregans]|uniref:cbb3-type cytochrome c oxidase subunit I n=1 Tax=Edaphobacter aggregans TaxID=570835 RepID=UPI0009FFF8DA|nr:cbb3-type cytochrome c oxidase subunit I [Edaphobacter aggregans]
MNGRQHTADNKYTADEPMMRAELPRVDYDLIRWHGHAALITVLISALFGILVATKFNFPTFLGGHAWETWGRLRYNHTQGIFFGWLGNVFIAFCYYVVPRLTNRPVTSRRLGWGIFWVWNFAVVLPGWILVCAGFSQPLEWAEFPIIVDLFVILAFVLMLVQFARPILRVPAGDLYVSGWYIVGGLVFTTLAYPIGNLVPELASGAKGAAFSGLWIHDAVGLFVTPLALSMAYYVIPSVTRRPIYSHFISMMGFWLLFFIYPLNGTHHYVYSAIPMSAQRGAIIASIYLGLTVTLVVTNLLLSLRGSSDKVGGNVPLRFVWFGVVAYLLVSLQGSMQSIMPVNRFIHFSDWVIGHSHLAMIGFASFIAAGALAHVWSSLPGARYNVEAISWAYWLLAIGLSLMVIDLTAAGLVEGQLWVSRAPWIDSVRAMYPYWLTRTISGIPILAGFLLFWIGLVTGPRNAARPAPANIKSTLDGSAGTGQDDLQDKHIFHGTPSILGYAFVIAFVAGFGFFILSFVVLGILPARQLEAEIKRTAPHAMQPLTAAEQHGREIYGREGCAYCHTEQVRVITADVVRFGGPTAPWETQYDYPHLWGTRRIGPDLSREHGLRADDWHFAHLFDPRATVPDSIMPAYSWMFNGSAAKPNRDALDLVAYLRSLGRERELAGDSGNEQVDHGMAMEMTSGYTAQGIPDTRPLIDVGGINPDAPIFAMAGMSDAANKARGRSVFQHNCSGCHGVNADDHGIARPGLLPAPANLFHHHYSDADLATILWDGVYGSAMPTWRQLDKADLVAVAAYVESLQAPITTVSMSPQDLDAASKLFAANCVSCHGEHGDGDGPSAGALKPSPVNFHVRQPTADRAWSAIERGIPGSSMPAWKSRLSDDERRLLVKYVQSMYDSGQKEAQDQ